MKIDYANLRKQYLLQEHKINKNIAKVLKKSNFILGDEVNKLEVSLKKFTKLKYAITCSSGTDALILALMALDISPGDEVITTPFTFIATAETIAFLGARPKFVDINDFYNIDVEKIEKSITKKTKAIIPVGLFGQPSDLTEIQLLARKHRLKVIIDGAQCFGSFYKNKLSLNYCDIYTTSFFPSKPLGCYGDGGAIFTNNKKIANKILSLRVHGQTKRYYHKNIGISGRLDTIQAGILLAKLPFFKSELKKRNKVARIYNSYLHNDIKKPLIKNFRTSVWAQYTIKTLKRNLLKKYLVSNNIPVNIHYPLPLHLQPCFKYLGYKKGDFPCAEKTAKQVLSLPMNPFLTNEEIKYISNKVNSFFNK